MPLTVPITLVGCGQMGRAMLRGWLTRGIKPAAVTVVESNASAAAEIAREFNVAARTDAPADLSGIVLFAVKPQVMQDVLAQYKNLVGNESLIISVAAGKTLAFYESALGEVPVIRAMPNLPGLIAKGVTGLIGNSRATAAHKDQAEQLFRAIGQVVWLDDEEKMHALTALSGSGPAYVFYFMQTLIEAGVKAGLEPKQAKALVFATLEGSVALARDSSESLEKLRQNVASPGGTTEAALKQLLADDAFAGRIEAAVQAATQRSRTL